MSSASCAATSGFVGTPVSAVASVYSIPQAPVLPPGSAAAASQLKNSSPRSVDARAGQQRHADQLADDADVVGMPHQSIRPGRHQRRARQDEHPVGPALAERGDRPELESLRRRTRRRRSARGRPRGPDRAAQSSAFHAIATNTAGYAQRIVAVDRVGGFDGAAAQERARCGETPQLAEHQRAVTTASGDAERRSRRAPRQADVARRRRSDTRPAPSSARAASAAAARARGEPTSARSARLMRHLPANSRRSAARGAANGRHAGLELAQRGLRGELAAAKREPQAVARHRIDEPRGVAGQQQPRTAGGARLDRERAERP